MKRSVMLGVLVGWLVACKRETPPSTNPAPTASAAQPAAASASAAVAPRVAPARRTGSSVGRTTTTLYVADEDASVLRSFPLPLADKAEGGELKMPGPPAQVLGLADGSLLVTIRDPGLLLLLREDEGTHALTETARIEVPADAWGMALSNDERRLVVTSPWTHQISLIDLPQRKVLATLDTAREPRGAVFTRDDAKVYVSHLMGTELTRLDLGDTPRLTRVRLPAGPLYAPRGSAASASLGYALAISDDGSRLFAPRHALGAISQPEGSSWWGSLRWWGEGVIDGLFLATEAPLAPERAGPGPQGDGGKIPSSSNRILQPRDVLYRPSTRTLLVANEGIDAITEHSYAYLDPGSGMVDAYSFGSHSRPDLPYGEHMGGPQGMVLSADEQQLYVWARASRELVQIHLDSKEGPSVRASFGAPAGDKEREKIEMGRRAFYSAASGKISGGLACAGCHPEGRDDGFVWHEAQVGEREKSQFPDRVRGVSCFVANPAALQEAKDDGYPRQTPMLAGRVSSPGPYNWHAKNRTLNGRIEEGFGLHRWCEKQDPLSAHSHALFINPLVAFLRSGGLRPPPRDPRPLTPEEERGKAVFLDEKTQCKNCHTPETEYTTRAAVPLTTPLATRPGFAAEEDQAFKVPSLLFVGGTAPYYHDGSVPTLEALIEKNGRQMGDTTHLSAGDRSALVAFLKRL